MESITNYLKSHQHGFVRQLRDLVAIQSVSTDGRHGAELKRAATWVATAFEQAGLSRVEVFPGTDRQHGGLQDADIVFAAKEVDPRLPTVLFYSHYDVQPVDADCWRETQPFVLAVKDGKAFGRGVLDDKGGFLAQLAVCHAFQATGQQLPVNVKLLVEGTEELGSPFLVPFLEQHRRLLAADVLVVTDTDNFDFGKPAVTYSLRGILNIEVTVRSARFPSHSGMVGGGLADPAMALVVLLTRLYSPTGQHPVPGLYDRVRPLSPEELQMTQHLEPDPTTLRERFGVLEHVQLAAEDGSFQERTTRWPAISVIGLEAGSWQCPSNQVLPEARALVSVRLVPDQDPDETLDQMRRVLTANPPWDVHVQVERRGVGVPAWMTSPCGAVFETALKSLRQGYDGAEPCYLGAGCTIGYVGSAARLLNAEPLLLGISGGNAHSHDEFLDLDDWTRLQFSLCWLLRELAASRR